MPRGPFSPEFYGKTTTEEEEEEEDIVPSLASTLPFILKLLGKKKGEGKKTGKEVFGVPLPFRCNFLLLQFNWQLWCTDDGYNMYVQCTTRVAYAGVPANVEKCERFVKYFS